MKNECKTKAYSVVRQ